MSEAETAVYCIDSSSLIDCQRAYPIDIFPSLWARFDALITANRLIAPEEVWLEFNKGTSFLIDWAATWKPQLSVPADAAQIEAVRQIARDFPLANYTTIDEHRADAWVVALGRTRSCRVVSQERGESAPYPKIPQMCRKYGIEHLAIFEMMRVEGWTF